MSELTVAALTRFQDRFAAALLQESGTLELESLSWAMQPGFAVYRNTVMKACIDALQANYPAVARLVGDEWFRAAAARYVRAHLPREPMLVRYGEDFPTFLSSFEPAQDMPWLAGVARLDRFWSEAHVARDQAPLSADALAALPLEALARTALQPHATARWAWFAEQPILSLWQRNRRALSEVEVSLADIAWVGEGVLLTRPQSEVIWKSIGAGASAFLDMCARGAILADAAAAAQTADAEVDLTQVLAALLDAGALSAMRAHATPLSATDETR